ncbi:MAG: FG-GAP-like repeat-containing protein [Verrucomicrobiota bacterium]
MALTDLDGDGDLDFVVNNLNGVCGLYRNSPAPRVAVQLEGLGANRPGIGARVTLRGGAVSAQTQELACGMPFQDRNLFWCCGRQRRATDDLEVAWRSGRRTTVEKVQANRLYAIPEEDDSTAPRPSPASDAPGRLAQTSASLFLDVSERINHSHVENLFDDFGRQPLLPRKLSQLGPGVAWIDLDGNNTEDLVLGTGRGGHLAIYYGDGHGAFRPATTMPAIPRDLTGLVAAYDARGLPVVVAGSANYEESLPAGPSAVTFDSRGQPLPDSFPANPASTGPLALADFDGDGDLDLFVGGRVVPKRYPEPVSSRLFRRNGDRWQLDAESSRALDQIGLVSGAVWSDLDGDGFPELVLACEWGPVRVFKKKEERLQDITAECGLAADIGWWNGVNTGDFDGDGRLDIVASNWGLNSCYQASADRPRRVFFGDLMKRGIVDLVETEFDPNRNGLGFLHRLDYMAAGLPALRELFATSQQYSEALVEPVLAKFGPPPSQLQATTLASMLFLNRGGRFEARPLPREAQFAPAFAVNVADFDGDGREDVFLSQNFFAVPWQLPRQDAGRGLLLLGDGRGGFRSVPGQESGIKVYGEQRGAAAADFDGDGRVDLAVSQNGSATRLFRNQNGRPGLRIRLVSAQGNPDGVGSLIRLQFGERPGPVREVHAGSGYWSQDGLVQVIAAPEPATAVVVRWPGGRLTTNEVANGSREVIVVDPDR